MAHCVDGFVLPVPKLDDCRRIAETAGKVWKEHGALEYCECIGDDVKPGKVTSFPQGVRLNGDETVVFAWIVYGSREQRDRVNDKEPRHGASLGSRPGRAGCPGGARQPRISTTAPTAPGWPGSRVSRCLA